MSASDEDPVGASSDAASGAPDAAQLEDASSVGATGALSEEESALLDTPESAVDAAGDEAEPAPASADAVGTGAEATASDDPFAVPEGFRSGFVTFVGRPNAGKSTLLNQILGEKVAIVSDKPQTTRNPIRGVLNRPDAQVVFVDTPGIHKPRSSFNETLNQAATQSIADVDVVCLIIDASAPIGRGDEFIAETLGSDAVVVLTKADRTKSDKMIVQLAKAAEWDFAEFFPVSGRTGVGVDALVDALVARLPEGPRLYPLDMVTDQPDAFWVAELVREQLLAATRQELPHSIATRVTEWEWPYVRVEILVERESQKGIVIGKKGAVLKAVGEAARAQLADGAYLDLHVKVVKDWQDRPDRLGYGPST